MPSDRSGRWGDAAAAGALIAGGGALTLSHGASMPKGAPFDPSQTEKLRAKAEARNAANQRKRLAGLNAMLDEDTRVNAGRKVGEPAQYRVNAHMINNQKQAVQGADERHRLAALEDVNRRERNAGRVAAAGQRASRRRVMRIGSGALGAGASLAVLGGVMAERRRKQGQKVAPQIETPREVAPSDRPLKDYKIKPQTTADARARQRHEERRADLEAAFNGQRSPEAQRKYDARHRDLQAAFGGKKANPRPQSKYAEHLGIPENVSPSAGRDWLKANKDRA